MGRLPGDVACRRAENSITFDRRRAACGAKRPFVLGMNWRPKIWLGPLMQHICNTTNLSY
jgi:hypothetical protein